MFAIYEASFKSQILEGQIIAEYRSKYYMINSE